MTSTTNQADRTTATVPATMTAAVQRHYSGPENITSDTVAVPQPGKGEVLIEVRAAGLDRGAWHLATGKPYLIRVLGFGLRRPKQPVVGGEVAGVVAAVGEDVTTVKKGDAVFGAASGAFAEYAIAKATEIAVKPNSLSFAQAAAAVVSALTAQVALDKAEIRKGQRVLVLGASGGVGSFVTQFAVAAGAIVTGVASAAKADLVRELGAESCIDYRAMDITEADVEFDAIIDAGGLNPVKRLRRILTPTGTLVIVGGEGGGSVTGGFVGRNLAAALGSATSKQKLVSFVSATNSDALDRVAARIVAGEATPAITATYPLEKAGQALVDMAAGKIAGKAVVAVR